MRLRYGMIIAMNTKTRQLAIIGPTASGKSALAITVAKSWNAYILSLDSLAIYREIDIVSAKPTEEEREGTAHYGIDLIWPDEPFDVTIFAKLYRKILNKARKDGKNLVIVGGTSFYLKSLLDGISPLPSTDREVAKKIESEMSDMQKAYRMLEDIDPEYMKNIEKNDRYRIEKALTILFSTGNTPSHYFETNPPQPTVRLQLPVYRILTERSLLRDRISRRTERMLKDGLIDEVAYLEHKYSRTPNCMKAIGIKETLDYLDGKFDREALQAKIIINTARLAKRQTTFNNSQFKNLISLDLENLKRRILEDIAIRA